MGIGTWILESFGAKGKFVGRIVDIDKPAVDADDDVTPVYHVLYEDKDKAIITQEKAIKTMQDFDSSGFKLTTGWTSPEKGVRQLRRMEKALEKRRKRRAK